MRRSRNEELTSLDKDETQYRTSSQKLQQEAGKLNSIIKANQESENRHSSCRLSCVCRTRRFSMYPVKKAHDS